MPTATTNILALVFSGGAVRVLALTTRVSRVGGWSGATFIMGAPFEKRVQALLRDGVTAVAACVVGRAVRAFDGRS